MPDKKLTDSEIVKALEICSTYKGKCTDCPAFVKVDRSNCKKVLLGAVEIINHLQAENERLKEKQEKCFYCTEQANKKIGEIKSEAYKECIAKVNEIITEIYNKHIFGSNNLNDEEKDAIINFSDDVSYKLRNLVKTVGETNE